MGRVPEERTGLVDWEAVRWQDGSGDRAVFERQQQGGGEVQGAQDRGAGRRPHRQCRRCEPAGTGIPACEHRAGRGVCRYR